MEKKNYIVKRKDIYLGEVVKATSIYKRIVSGNEPSGSLDIKSAVIYRNMLFTPTDNKFASDLLYNTADYPILNGTSNDYVLNLKNGSILIKDYYNLEELLEYFCYGEELNINDIVKFYNTFFTGLFSKRNPELFGKELITAEEIKYYKNDRQITEEKELKMCQNEYKILQKLGKGLYRRKEESVLSRYYWDILQNDKSSFKPKREEGKIKKLTKF